LFIPGNRTSWVAKAVAAGADAVILDLEDAVADADKLAAARPVDPHQHRDLRRGAAGSSTTCRRWSGRR
jgi:citrate lyase subunit beta/citryl-CoA lyase